MLYTVKIGSGTVTDQVQYAYDDWGNVSTFTQDVDSAIGVSGRAWFAVSYSYTKKTPSGGHDYIARTGMTLPGSGDSNTITYTYSSSSSIDELAGRVTSIKTGSGGGTTRVSYAYLGVAQVVGTDLAEPGSYSRLYGSGTANYDAIDRFNRTTLSRWTKSLGTPRNFYEVTLGYDRDSNITVATDAVHPGYDASYSMDGRNRLTRAEEGTWSGSAITGTTRDQQWTLSQPGNWSVNKLDLDGDGLFTGGGELNDTGTFNVANELTARDTDTNGSPNYTLSYDAAGNQTDDGKDYTYVYDAFGRMTKVSVRGGGATVAEYRYNGLNFRISTHSDLTRSGGGAPDGTVDSNDPTYYLTYDERWRQVATFRGTDSDPKERFVWHNAGLGGKGGSSYIDCVVLRDRDINSGWTSAADGTLEERFYYCQNWRADVSVIMSSGGQVKEWVKYSAYGVPMSITPADFDGDGFVTGDDDTAFNAAYGAGTWNARTDLNLDGVIDSTDLSLWSAEFGAGEPGGYATLSRASIANKLGYAGYQHAPELAGSKWHVRNRVLDSDTGRWTRRESLGQRYSIDMYAFIQVSSRIANNTLQMPCNHCALDVVATPSGIHNRNATNDGICEKRYQACVDDAWKTFQDTMDDILHDLGDESATCVQTAIDEYNAAMQGLASVRDSCVDAAWDLCGPGSGAAKFCRSAIINGCWASYDAAAAVVGAALIAAMTACVGVDLAYHLGEMIAALNRLDNDLADCGETFRRCKLGNGPPTSGGGGVGIGVGGVSAF